MSAAALALPDPLKELEGRIIDLDSHEMIPAQDWIEVFGPEVAPMRDAWLANQETDEINKNSPNVPGYPGDILEIGSNIVTLKGCRAPGAKIMERRLDVMNAMGVRKQLVFSSFVGIFSMIMLMNPDDKEFLGSIREDREGIASRLLSKYHDWAVGVGEISDRLRPVAPIYAPTVDGLIAIAKDLIDRGIRAIQLPAGKLPGDVSPAHPDMDPFWALLADANCTLITHIGGDGQFFETRRWHDAPVFDGFKSLGEFDGDPWSRAVMHLPFQNFVTVLVTGGVFDRHPNLRCGVIEVGAHWVGPMMRVLDLWYVNSKAFKTNSAYELPELPSHYVRKNVRVTPYVFEPVDEYIEQYGLEDVLCFSSDYPHVEGGRDMLKTFYDKVARLGDDVVEKFFVTNGRLLTGA